MKREYKASHEETARQKKIMERLKRRLGTVNRSYFITTFGCQMNAHDSEKLKGILEEIGFAEASKEEQADFILYNTCCVRENAELKVYGRLGYLKGVKKRQPEKMIAICGCMMQQETVIEKLKKSYRHVDLVFGTHNLYKLAELIETRLDSDGTVFDIWDSHKDIVEDLPTIRQHPYKASVNIMYGCNNFCTYCIVPYVRGRERSRMPEDILAEITDLAKDGVKEIILLGQNVNSYGKTLKTPVTFASLLRKVAEVEGIERIRFMTSHPKDLSEELIDTMAMEPKICNYLHLPLQSGSTAMLEKMNRRYSKESYLALVDKIQSKIPDIALSTDIIVGFPGETEEDFEDTLDVYRKAAFASAFTFIYSKRTGTPAATMEDQVDPEAVKERFNRLLEVADEYSGRFHSNHIGLVCKVLLEEQNGQNPELLTGRTEHNSLVHVEAGPEWIGKLADVRITAAKTYYLSGEIV